MGRPTNSDGRQTRQSILDAALDLFAEKGYFGTTLRDIASAVGVRESALYNYYTGKEALFGALIASVRETKAEQWASLLAAPLGDVRAVLERVTTSMLDSFCEPRQERLFRVLMSDGVRLAKEGKLDFMDRLASRTQPLHELMRRLIADGGLARRDPEILALEFAGPLIMWRHLHAIRPGLPLITNRQAFIREHVAHFMEGAVPRLTRRSSAARRARGGAAGSRRSTAAHSPPKNTP
jgi:AcrR family transcriptional regulator